MKKVLLIPLICFILIFVGCGKPSKGKGINQTPIGFNGLVVSYVDVGEGDCIFMEFPDGKFGMIDCGEKNVVNQKTIDQWLAKTKGAGLDFMLITHPDSDHMGNADYVIENYKVNNLYVPYIMDKLPYDNYHDLVKSAKQQSVKVYYTDYTTCIKGEDYRLLCLLPKPVEFMDSAYHKFNYLNSEYQLNPNILCPIIYLESFGKRFLFSGDAPISTENELVSNYYSGIYDYKYPQKVVLENIDFFKVPHHGANDGCSDKLVDLIKPIHSIISVGAGNSYGHPSTMTIFKLTNKDSKVYRTDVHGAVSVFVSEDGKYNIKTQK